jgi:hypothetical protein
MAKKSAFNTRKTAEPAEKKFSSVPMNNSTSWRDEEEQVDYEPETPPSLYPVVDDNSEPEDRLRTPVPGETDDSDPDDGFCKIPAEDAVMAGTKRRRISQQLPNKGDVAKDLMAALPRKGGKTFYSAEADEDDKDVMALPRKSGKTFFPAKADDDDKDVMAAPPRKGGKTVFPAEADDVGEDVMAAPPRKGGKTFSPAEAGDVDENVMAAPPRKGGKTFSC